jgi:hypothetical protein
MTKEKQQHVNLHQKLLLRRYLLGFAVKETPIYVPFIGDGDIAHKLYRDRPIYGADIDADRVTTCLTRDAWPAGLVTSVADCDEWPFLEGTTPAFGVADFDAYAYPYASFRAFWQHAEKISPLVIMFTDGQRYNLARAREASLPLPDGSRLALNKNETTKYFRFYYRLVILPWLKSFLDEAGWKLKVERHYDRGVVMTYWGAVIERDSR